jgi:hypothetical protein
MRPALDSHTPKTMIRSTITRIIILYVFAVAFVACRYEPPPPEEERPQLQTRTVWQRTDLAGKRVQQKYVLRPNVLTRCETGSQLGPDGLVSQPSDALKITDPIHLSMWLAESPAELQVSMRVLDAKDNEIGIARRDLPAGAKAVTMKVGEQLEPGRYKLEGFWGGNLVCEKGIEVRE